MMVHINPFCRYKHVTFEIIPTDEPGVFDVSGKFMNVQMDKVELVFQVILYKSQQFSSN